MNVHKRKEHTGTLAALLLFAVFAVCVLFVLLTGAELSGRIRDRDAAVYDSRTAEQYLTTKVRQADRVGQVFVADFSGGGSRTQGDTLFLVQQEQDGGYCTRIYCYDGYLRELFTDLDGEFAPEDGEVILPAERLAFTLTDGLLTVFLDDETEAQRQLTLYLRSGEVAP